MSKQHQLSVFNDRVNSFASNHHATQLLELLDPLYEVYFNEPERISKIQKLILAADQFPTCLQSSGIFCYFELQTPHAPFGKQAMEFLGLAEMKSIIENSAKALNLPDEFTENDVVDATASLIGGSPEFDFVLEQLELLEDRFYESTECVETALSDYIRQNSHDVQFRLN